MYNLLPNRRRLGSRARRAGGTVGQTVLPARHSAFVLKREEAKQADGTSRAKPMASQ